MFSAATKGTGINPRMQFVNNYQDPNNFTTYTFSSVSFGEAAGRSLVVVYVSGHDSNSRSISSVTIGGVAATEVTASSAGIMCGGLYQAYATGTSGDVVVTFSGECDAAGLGVWALYDLQSTTASSSASNAATSSDVSVNVNTLANGFLIAGGSARTGTTRTYTWTNATERFDTTYTGSNSGHTGADFTSTTAETPRAITVQASGSISRIVISSAFWK
jgi:hypothetical protein